jgi:hypothetical protein
MARGFANDVSNFVINFEKASEESVRVTTAKTWNAIVAGWPVDEGRSRANWFATGQLPSTRTTESVDNSENGETTSQKAQQQVSSIKRWDSFFLTNNLPYSPVIEYGGYPNPVKLGTRNKDGSYTQNSSGGYSKQAPNGSVRINMKKSQALLEAESSKRFKGL